MRHIEGLQVFGANCLAATGSSFRFEEWDGRDADIPDCAIRTRSHCQDLWSVGNNLEEMERNKHKEPALAALPMSINDGIEELNLTTEDANDIANKITSTLHLIKTSESSAIRSKSVSVLSTLEPSRLHGSLNFQSSPKLASSSEYNPTSSQHFEEDAYPSLSSYTKHPSPSARITYPDLSEFSDRTIPRAPLSSSLVVGSGIKDCVPPGEDKANGRGNAVESDMETFYTPLGYHIPFAKMRAAQDADPESIASYWQYTMYQGPKGDTDKVRLHYCRNNLATEKVAQLFLDEEIVGFDIEWKPNVSAKDDVKENVSLIQVASETRVALFHIALYPDARVIDDYVAPSFKRLMESPSISKVGVAIKGDCTRLRNFMGIDSRGLFELSYLHKLVKYASNDHTKINKVSVSLAQQVQEHLQLPLCKGNNVRHSDWTRELNSQQLQYAASDSYAGFQLYHRLEAKRKALNPTPPRPAHAELNLPIRLNDGQAVVNNDDVPVNIEDDRAEVPVDPGISIEELTRSFTQASVEDSCSLQQQPETSTKPGVSIAQAPTALRPSTLHSGPSVPPQSMLNHSQTSKRPQKMPSLEYAEADDWANSYLVNIPKNRKVTVTRGNLRAYHLWHHQLESGPLVANILQVKLSTAAGYIFRAIHIEHLPFDRSRAWALAPHLHELIRGGYNAMLWERCKKLEEEQTKRISESETSVEADKSPNEV